MKKRDVKGKGENERYTHFNEEFQRIARKDKKAFITDQCKELEGNNRMGKIRDLFKKIRDAKETFHAKMVTIKDRYCVDLTEADNIKNRWQEYIEELYKRYPHNTDNHNEEEVKSLNCVQLCAIPWTVAYKAPLSMEFSRQEYWSGFKFPSPGDLPDPRIEPRSPALQASVLPSEPPGNPMIV